MQRNILIGVLLLLLLGVLSACAGLSAEQRAAAIQAFDDMLARGLISQEQYSALVDALSGSMSKVWSMLSSIGEVAVSVLLSYLGITWVRGPVGNRKGIVAEVQKK